MSTGLRADGQKGVYYYRFNFKGERFSGSTGQASKAKADAVEREEKAKVKARYEANKAMFGKRLTLIAAAERWFDEHGRNLDKPEIHLKRIRWLLDHFGDNTMLADIDDSRVAHMVAKRRAQVNQAISKAAPRPISTATVNRTAVEPLRAIIVRARKVWKIETGDVDWSLHRSKESKGRVRELSIDEQAALLEQLDRGYREAVEFLLLTGCRQMEMLGLRWTDVSFTGRKFSVLGKRGKMRSIPMTQKVYDLLWAEQGNHSEYVFTFVSAYTRRINGEIYVRGGRYPMTAEGFSSNFERAVDAAGIDDFSVHDTRHTALTRMARNGNLKAVQMIAGHSRIEMTLRYVHPNEDDMRATMENMAASRSYTKSYTGRRLRVVK